MVSQYQGLLQGESGGGAVRAIYSNGTESNLLRRSLYNDEAGRRLNDPDSGPLFGSAPDEEDRESGTKSNLGATHGRRGMEAAR